MTKGRGNGVGKGVGKGQCLVLDVLVLVGVAS